VSVIANNASATVDFIGAFVDPSFAGCAGEANTRFMTLASSLQANLFYMNSLLEVVRVDPEQTEVMSAKLMHNFLIVGFCHSHSCARFNKTMDFPVGSCNEKIYT